MKRILKKIFKWLSLLFIILLFSLVLHNQYTIEKYIKNNKSRYVFLEDRNRKSYIPFTFYDVWGIISENKKQKEFMICDELFKKYGYPMNWSPNKDTYLISIHFTRKEKNELLKGCREY